MSGYFNNIASSRNNCNSNGGTDDQLIINGDSTPPALPPRPPQQPPYQTLVGHNVRLPYYYAPNGGYSSENMDFRTTQDMTNIQQPQTSIVTSTNYPYYAQNLPTTTDTYRHYGDLYKILENNSSNTFKSINSIIQALNSIVNAEEYAAWMLKGLSMHYQEQKKFYSTLLSWLTACRISLLCMYGDKARKTDFGTGLKSRQWATGESDYYSGTVLFDFSALNSNEVSIKANQMLRIAPKACDQRMVTIDIE
uniref:NAD(P)(+)--arginine ADP-ribosyltransferase n=1 Tax=Romanomermis culicivorax TaxID=13658 RepID=A0A915L9B9_ROMCU